MAYVIIYMNYLLTLSLYLVDLQINISTFHVTQSSASTSVINNSNILIIFYNCDCQYLLTLAFPQSLLLWISDISFHLEFIQVGFSLWSIKLYPPSLPKPLFWFLSQIPDPLLVTAFRTLLLKLIRFKREPIILSPTYDLTVVNNLSS